MSTRSSSFSLRARAAAGVACLVITATACESVTEPRAELPTVTRVSVAFTPVDAGFPVTAYIEDPDGNGPLPPEAQVGDLVFLAGASYTATVTLETRTATSLVDVTETVADRGTTYRVYHRVFGLLTGAGFIVTPTDVDARDRPVGLRFTAAVHPTMGGNTGSLLVTLCEYQTVAKSATSTECVGEDRASARFAMSAIN